MDVREAIEKRRAYRSFEQVKITEELIKDLAGSAQLAPSCFNDQPWRFIFVYDPDMLKELHSAMSKGNEWTFASSMIIAVASRPDLDCIIKGREYYLFDTGMAVSLMILRATELGLVAHPIAGYDEDRVKEILNIPVDMKVITLVIVGKHSDKVSTVLSEKQMSDEERRPERLPFEKFAFINRWQR
jgi:nitroreductase